MTCQKCETDRKHLRANLLKVADYVDGIKIPGNPDIAREVVMGMTDINLELIKPTQRTWLYFNSTFQMAKGLLGLEERQAIVLFFFWATDNELAWHTDRNEAEKQFIEDWRATRSTKKRRDLAVKVILYYADQWTAEPECNCLNLHTEECPKFDPAIGLRNLKSNLSCLDTMMDDGFSITFTKPDGKVKMTLVHPSQTEEFDGDTVEEIVSGEFPRWFSNCQEMM